MTNLIAQSPSQSDSKNRYRPPLLEELKARLDLVSVAQHFHPSIQSQHPKLYQGSHDGVHPSVKGQCLTIWPQTNSWKCFNCGQGGDVIDLIGVAVLGASYSGKGDQFQQAIAEATRLAGIDFSDFGGYAALSLADRQNHTEITAQQDRLYQLLTEAAHWFNTQLARYPDIATHLHTNYGFETAFVKHKAIGFAPPLPLKAGSGSENEDGSLVAHLKQQGYQLEEMQAASIVNKGGYCRYQGRIMFPYWQHERVVYFTARATTYTPRNEYELYPNGEYKKYRKLKIRDEANPQISALINNEILLGIDNLKLAHKRGYVLITEGAPDQLAAEQAGEPCISSVTTRFSQTQNQELARHLQGLKVYVCNDNELNQAGEKGALATARYLEEQGIKVYLIKLPRPAELEKIDLCEFIRDQGGPAFTALYPTALRLPDYLLTHLYQPRLRLPHTGEDKAKLVTELAELAVKVCQYDPISLTNLQQHLAAVLEFNFTTIRAMFAPLMPTPARNTSGSSSRPGQRENAADQATSQKKSQATLVMELLQEAVELFHTAEQRAYATLAVGDHLETWAVRSRGFKLLIKERFYREYGTVPRSQALEDALSVLEAKGLYGPEIPVYGRLAWHEGCIYLDLSNPKWEVVKISSEGWEVLRQSPIKFRRTNGMLSIPQPVGGGRLDELLDFINITPSDWKLLAAWLVTALNPDCQYPVLMVSGEQGSAKSTASRFIRRLLDPSITLLRATPKDERDFWIAAQNSWVLAYDNLSDITPWLSDTLCRVATGGGNATRLLYTDDEEVFFEARRPVLLNGIETIASRSDLLERSLIISLPTIDETNRVSEKELVQEFEEALPRILGGLLDAVSLALGRVKQLTLERLPRMADFTLWAMAAEPTFGGCDTISFVEVYNRQRARSHVIALEASPLGQAFLHWYDHYCEKRLAEDRMWLGPAGRLLQLIEESLSEKEIKATTRQVGWPRNPRALSVQLHRLAPDLRALGIELSFDVYEGEVKRGIRIARTNNRSASSGSRGKVANSGTQNPVSSTQKEDSGTQSRPQNELFSRAKVENFDEGTQIQPNSTPNLPSQEICVPVQEAQIEANAIGLAAIGTQNTQNRNKAENEVNCKQNEAISQCGKSGEICVPCVPPGVLSETEEAQSPILPEQLCFFEFEEDIAECANDYQSLLQLKARLEASSALSSAEKCQLSQEIRSRINHLLFPSPTSSGTPLAIKETTEGRSEVV